MLDQKPNLREPNLADFATPRIGTHYTKVRHRSRMVTTAEKGHYARACRQRRNNNRTVKKLTEETENEPNESLSKSDESIHHLEEIKNIEEKKETLHSEKKRGKKRIHN